MTTQLNKIYAIKTIALVAQEMGEDEQWLNEIIDEMEPEDGLIWSMDQRAKAPQPSLTSASKTWKTSSENAGARKSSSRIFHRMRTTPMPNATDLARSASRRQCPPPRPAARRSRVARCDHALFRNRQRLFHGHQFERIYS
jgi:hypothetical protein